MTGLVLDSNALTRWAAHDLGILAHLEAVQRAGGAAYVPTVCLVESLTGAATDAPVRRLRPGARTVKLDAALAGMAARLRDATDGDDVADPVVVATAAALGAVALSSDPDITVLAAHAEPPVAVVDPRGWEA